MKRALITIITAALAIGAPYARAQWAVADAGNLVQNTTTAMNSVRSVAQQISAYQLQLQQYANQVKQATGLADASLIQPFPGTTAPRWLLDALGRGLAGVTFFGQNVTGDTQSLTASLRAAAPVEPVIAIDEEGGDVTRVAYASGSPYISR